jgi:uncharacterized protein
MKRRTVRKKPKESPGVDASLARHGGLSYLELPATDVHRSGTFYKKVLGWKLRGGKADPSKFSDQSGHLIGRWVTGRAINRKPGLLAFFYVNRLDVAVKRVIPCAGEMVRAPHPEGDVLIAIVRDPAGNLIGLWQDASR